MITLEVLIVGIVQGVGFRPFVYKSAINNNINGFVKNTNKGVYILAQGSKENIESFLDSFNNPPQAAQIESINTKTIMSHTLYTNFQIKKSDNKDTKTADIAPDIAMCDDCKEELFDKQNKRYLYPFTSCTNCGGRYSIIKELPYDRDNTAMDIFAMCDDCKEEYNDINNRRFHSQINCCKKCGPRLIFTEIFDYNNLDSSLNIESINPLQNAINAINNGHIIALKGLGGYTLVCDATNNKAIKNLRARKKRPTKPFAIMCKDISMAKLLAKISKQEEELLLSPQAPIVLCDINKSHNIPLHLIAPNLNKLGIILPYTPIHHLLCSQIQVPLIFTSANISGEPIIKDFKNIYKKLQHVCDYALTYNRDIINPIDDSLVRAINNQMQILRRARGFNNTINTLNKEQNFIALGAEQKNTFCININNKTMLSPHLGDLYNIESLNNAKETIRLFTKQYNANINEFIADMHPLYSNKKLVTENSNLHTIQHHFAHLLSNIAENKINKKTLGIIFDGTGYGLDGNIWGGEFLLYDPKQPLKFRRIAFFESFYLLGGEKAIKDIRRLGLEGLFLAFGNQVFQIQHKLIDSLKDEFGENAIDIFYKQHKSGKMPRCNSIGRLFDMVAILCNAIDKQSYEGECGMILESLAETSNITHGYSFKINNQTISIKEILLEIIKDIHNKESINNISKKFHITLVNIINEISKLYAHEYEYIAISGGCFQNKLLTSLIQQTNKNIYINKKIPCNDGGISVGQAYYMNLKNKMNL